MSISVRRLSSVEIPQYIADVARLRIKVFKEFPYIYEGSESYEVKYLDKYLKSKKAALIAAFAENKVIGMASCLPLDDEEPYVQKAFLNSGQDIAKIFYFGESVLDKEYRGLGLGKKFFAEREAWVSRFNQYEMTTFCAVQRPETHLLRPAGYIPHDIFWEKQGYKKQPRLQADFIWQDIGEETETVKKMVFWTKNWNLK